MNPKVIGSNIFLVFYYKDLPTNQFVFSFPNFCKRDFVFPKKEKIPNFFPKTTFHPIFCLQKGSFFPREKQPLFFWLRVENLLSFL